MEKTFTLEKEFKNTPHLQSMFSTHYLTKYLAIMNGEMATPFIKCIACKGNYCVYKYSQKQDRVYANTSSNVLNHKCTEPKQAIHNQKLPQLISKKMPQDMRCKLVQMYAEELVDHPTVLTLSGVDIMNNLAN